MLDLAIRRGRMTVLKNIAAMDCLREGIRSDHSMEICDGVNVFEAERRSRRVKSVGKKTRNLKTRLSCR